MEGDGDNLTISLEAICDSFSSLLWDIEYYQCGSFEVYIAANPQNIAVFQTGRIVGRDDDNEHFGIIESVKIETDTENGDYLTVTGRSWICCARWNGVSYTLLVHLPSRQATRILSIQSFRRMCYATITAAFRDFLSEL